MAYYKYTTMQGDTFDTVALAFYDDEMKASAIMQANPDKIETIIFDAGIELRVPVIPSESASTLPPWRR
jgi:Phage Tail Protein X.